MKWVLPTLISLILFSTGLGHLFAPQGFIGFVPTFLPAGAVIALSGLAELAIAVAIWVPRTRALAGLAFAGWCLALLPLHVWDLVRPDPVFTTLSAAWVRLFVQAGFIAMGLGLWRQAKRRS
jgi:uncharacterized membrane protein